jgi:hypothetical protein
MILRIGRLDLAMFIIETLNDTILVTSYMELKIIWTDSVFSKPRVFRGHDRTCTLI